MKLTNEMPVREVEFQSATSFGIGSGAHSSVVDGTVKGSKIAGLKMTMTPAGLMWERPTKTKDIVIGLVPLTQCKSLIFFNDDASAKKAK